MFNKRKPQVIFVDSNQFNVTELQTRLGNGYVVVGVNRATGTQIDNYVLFAPKS